MNKTPRVPPEELILNVYTQDELKIIARRCLEPMWLSGKAEILQEITADLVKRAYEMDRDR